MYRVLMYDFFYIRIWSQLTTVAICFSVLLLGDIANAARHVLAPGDIQLPSKVVVRLSAAPRSIQEVKQTTRDAIHKLTPDFLKKSKSAPWTLSLNVIHNPHELSHHAICQEYVAYQLQPRMRAVRPDLKKMTVEVKDLNGNTKTCRFDIKKRLYLTPTRDMPNLVIGRKYKKLVVDGFGIVPFALLGHTKRPDANVRIIEFLIVVPFALSDHPRLLKFLSAAAREIYSAGEKAAQLRGITKNKDFIIRFTALPRGATEPSFTLPGLTFLAFRHGKSDIVFTSKMQYRLLTMRKVSDQETNTTPREFLSVTLLSENSNSCLSKDTFKKQGASTPADCVRIVANNQSQKALESFAQYAAEKYGVSEIMFMLVVQTKKPMVGLRWPIKYQRVGGKWKVILTSRTPALP